MSSPSTSTPSDNQISAGTSVEMDTPAWKYLKATWSERVVRMREVLATKPKKMSDTRVLARVQMKPIKESPEDGYQAKDHYRPCTTTIPELMDWVRNQPKIGLKDIGSGFVAGIGLTMGHNDLEHFVGAQTAIVDLDGLLKDEEQWQRFRAVVMPAIINGCGWCWFKTASHGLPGKGDRRRIIIPLAFTITDPEDYADLCGLICAKISAAFPGQSGLDEATSKKVTQVMYDPRYPNEERAKTFESGIEGSEDCWEAVEEMAELRWLRAERAAAKAAKKEEEHKAQAVLAEAGLGPSVVGVFDASGSGSRGRMDPWTRARARLAKIHIPVGCGVRNKRIGQALWACRDSGLDEEQSAQLVVDTYGDEVNERGWVWRQAKSLWKHEHTPSRWKGSGRKVGQASVLSEAEKALLEKLHRTGGGLVEFSLDAEPLDAEPTEDEQAPDLDVELGPSPAENDVLLTSAGDFRPLSTAAAMAGFGTSCFSHIVGEYRVGISPQDPQQNTRSLPDNATLHTPVNPPTGAAVGRKPEPWREQTLNCKDLPEVSYKGLLARVVYRRSPYGTSKNRSLRRMVRDMTRELVAFLEEDSEGNQRIVVIVHRRALARTIGETWGIPVYLDAPVEDITGSCVVCIDSIGRIAGGQIDLLITDESEQVIQHIFKGPLRKQRRTGEIWSAWCDVAQRSKKLIFQDARLGELTQHVARCLLDWRCAVDFDEQLIVNLWHSSPPEAHVWMEEEGWFESLMLALENRNPEVKDWLACLSRKKAEVLHEMIVQRRPDLADQILLVTSKTSKRKDVRACFKTPALFGEYRLVIASPSCGTGVSVEHVNLEGLGVWKVWMHAQSGSGPNALDALQMLHRVRVPRGNWQIYIDGTAAVGSSDPDVCENQMLLKTAKTILRIGELGTTWKSDNSDPLVPKLAPANKDLVRIDAMVQALCNEWGGTLGFTKIKDDNGVHVGWAEGSLIRALREIVGCHIIQVFAQSTDPKAVQKEMAVSKLTVEERELDKIEAAEDKPLEEAELAASAEDAPEEADAILARAQHVDFFYGGRPPAKLDRHLLRRDYRGKYRAQVALYQQFCWFRSGEADTVRLQDRKDLIKNKLAIDLRHRFTAAALVDEVLTIFGINDHWLMASGKIVITPPSKKAFTWDLRSRLKEDLGIGWNPEKSSPMRLLAAVMRKAGLELDWDKHRVPGSKSRKQAVDATIRESQVNQLDRDSESYRQRHHRKVVIDIPIGEFELAA